MASVVKSWWRKKTRDFDAIHPEFYESCIFQQTWREICTEWSRNQWSIRCLHLSQLTRHLLDSLLTHRFQSALHCLTALCGICKKAPELLWRTGCEVLKQTRGSHCQTVQFYKSMFTLCRPYREEILLDFAFYLIQEKNDITEAYELLNSQYGQKPYNNSKCIANYLGLLEFIQWKSNKLQFFDTTSSSFKSEVAYSSFDFSHESITGENSRRKVDFHGKRALAFFSGITNNSGVLDVFVSRHVELLLYYDKKDEAHKILKQYRANNPDNPNAHRYLYYFLQSTGASSTELRSVLAALLQVDPTSELASEFTSLSEDLTDILPALFNKLDHSACKNDINTWKTLADLLTKMHERSDPDELGLLKECWDTRSDWWPPYHFGVACLPRGDIKGSNILKHKADIAAILLGQGNAFTVEVRRRMAGAGLAEEFIDKQFPLRDKTRQLRKRKLDTEELLCENSLDPVPRRSKKDYY